MEALRAPEGGEVVLCVSILVKQGGWSVGEPIFREVQEIEVGEVGEGGGDDADERVVA